MSQPNRLASGGRIDRGHVLRFTFDGRPYEGFAGDTLASALLANGVRLVGRSFKYHRPRGILAAGAEEPNALVEIDRGNGRREPNIPATMVPLTDGLVARSQNNFPSLRFDLGALASWASPLLAAGFYYKTFLGPGRAWEKLYEPLIRRMAGLGRAPADADPDHYANRYAHCDVLIAGAGPAGLAAALAASESGARVILCDEQSEPGGSLLAELSAQIDGKPAQDWLADALTTLRQRPHVRILQRTTAFSYGLQNFVGLVECRSEASGPRERLWQVRAHHVVLATGAIERPLLFAGNDRPGIMLAEAARIYVNRYAVLPGRKPMLFASHDSGWRAAFDVHDAGARIVAIADMRPDVAPELVAEANQRGIPVMLGHGITTVRKCRISLSVNGARIAPRHADGTLDESAAKPIACDLVLMAGGWTPSIHLFSQSRGRPRWDNGLDAFVPGDPVQAQASAGACRGIFDLAACVADGRAAGSQTQPDRPAPTRGATAASAVAGAAAKAFVDFQNDVTSGDIRLAVREGFRSIEHVKRYTTNGMATDQGKTSNITALAVAAEALGRPIPEVGLTTFRAPYSPVTFGALAGRHRAALFDPIRAAPMHNWAASQGAVFEPVGLWQRARYFPRAGEDMHAAVARECLAVRRSVGMFDASTLGKIEVVGPDAAAFLDLLYVNAVARLGVGRCRYGLLLREDGFVYDDGVIARLAPDRFHVTTTTGGAAGVLHMMEDYLQTEFAALRVWLTSITEQWAVIAVQGPDARSVIGDLVEDVDVSNEAFPHMSVRTCRIAGVPARLFRVSFTGELGYEINVPAEFGPAVWDAAMHAGRDHTITPYGTETMHVLRAEKGYIIVGQETDGTVTPDDLGLTWAIGKNKPDFVGKRSLDRPAMRDPVRLQLVGLAPSDAKTVPEEGAQLVDGNGGSGHVTSAYWSAALGSPVLLGLLSAGRRRLGETVNALGSTGAMIQLKVVEPVFYDRPGARLNV